MRPAKSPGDSPLSNRRNGEVLGRLRDRGDALLGGCGEALGVPATAAELALHAGARLADVALELVASGVTTALELRDPPLGRLAGRGHAAQVADQRDGAV